jgi:threonine/homoserine/homoserine lactone efflux protein
LGLPSLIDLADVTPIAFAELAGVAMGVLALVFGFYIALAARARRLLHTPRAVRALNRTTGAVMAGAALAIAAR